MRVIPFHKNLPPITQKKSMYRFSRHLPLALNPSFIEFEKIREVIINTHSLPISIEVEHPQIKDLTVQVTPSNLTAKTKLESCSLPLHILKHSWLKIAFGAEFRKIEIRGKCNENKLSNTNFYGNYNTWKNMHPEEQLNLNYYSLEPLLNALKTKLQVESSIEQSNHKIGGLIRAKLSERANSYSHKQSIPSRVTIENSIHMGSRFAEHQEIDHISNGKKYDSATLNFNSFFDNRAKIGKRTSNTSNSIRSESNDARFSKKSRKIVQVPECKPTFGPTFFQEASEFIPIHKGKPRPRFYQQIPFTHQQLQLKRKKFQSQFIVIKESIEPNILKTNESEVTEEIIKCENSRLGNAFEDTFQRGMDQNQNRNGPDLPTQESGTLCQSVFE